MKTRYVVLIIAVSITAFILWSLTDMVCKPCIIPPDSSNYACPSVCNLEPRWISWFRDFTNMF